MNVNSQTGKPDLAPHQLWRHHKGNAYIIVCVAMREHDMVPLVVYGCVESGKNWCRPLSEFIKKFEFEAEYAPEPRPRKLGKLIYKALAFLQRRRNATY